MSSASDNQEFCVHCLLLFSFYIIKILRLDKCLMHVLRTKFFFSIMVVGFFLNYIFFCKICFSFCNFIVTNDIVYFSVSLCLSVSHSHCVMCAYYVFLF